MRWSDISYKCREQREFSEYFTTLRLASFSSIGSNERYICQIKEKVFSLPDWKVAQNIQSKDIDCMYVACNNSNEIPNKVWLIEFKGGNTIDDWDEGTLRFKIFDTIHCLLPKLLESDLWSSIFCEQCELVFVLAISPQSNIIKEQSDYDKIYFAKNKLKSTQKLVRIVKKCEELKILEKKLKKYSGKFPFSSIYIVDATYFSISNPRGYYFKIAL